MRGPRGLAPRHGAFQRTTGIDTTSPATPGKDPPYGWVIVAASAMILAAALGGLTTGVSVFFDPLTTEFGWQRGDVSSIYFAGVMGMAFGGVVMGRIADLTSARRVSLFGVVVLGVALLGMSRLQSFWPFLVLFFLAGFLGTGSLFAPLVSNVGKWFRVNPGLALGFTSAGQALGQGAVPYVAAFLIGAVGWRGALVTMAIVCLVVLAPLALLIRPPPRDAAASAAAAAGADDASPVPLSPRAVIVLLSAAVVFCCTCMSVPLVHLVPLAQDRGFSLDDAAGVLFLVLLAGIFGRIVFGRLADVIGPLPAYLIASLWQTVLVLGFVGLESLEAFYLFALVYGFGYAGVMTGILVSVNALVPVSRRGSALGIVGLFAWLGHGFGGYQGGLFFDLTGGYTVSYANAAAAGIVNLVIVASLYLTIHRRRVALAVAG